MTPQLQRSPAFGLSFAVFAMSGSSTQFNRRFLMKGLIAVFALLFGLGMISVGNAADPMGKGAAAGGTVKGEVLKVDGDNYTIKDATGKEIRIHVDKTTKTQGPL
jgi:hypothetical protein